MIAEVKQGLALLIVGWVTFNSETILCSAIWRRLTAASQWTGQSWLLSSVWSHCWVGSSARIVCKDRLGSVRKLSVSHGVTLYVQYTKNHSIKKWLLFDPICAVYLDYIVTSNCVRCNQFFWLYVQYTKTQPSKVSSISAYMCSILRVHSNL